MAVPQGQVGHRDGAEDATEDQRQARAAAGDQHGAERGGDHRAEGGGQQHDTGVQHGGGEAVVGELLRGLGEVADHHERAVHAEADEQAGEVGEGDGRAGHHLHVDQRVLDLDLDDAPEQGDHGGDGEQAEGLGGGPAPVVALADRDQQGGEPAGQGDGAERVGAALLVGDRVAGHPEGDQGDREQAEGQAHPEDRLVAPVLQQQAGGDQAEAAADAHRGADGGDAAGHLLLGQLVADDADGQREHATAGALEHAGDDQPGEGVGRDGERGARDQAGERDQQHRLAAAQVAEAAEQRGEHGGGQQIGRHQPGDAGAGDAQFLGERGQDRNDRGLHHAERQHRQDEGRQDPGAALLLGRGGGLWCLTHGCFLSYIVNELK